MILTGQPNALRKLKPTHPVPRCLGSLAGFPCSTAPGYPIDTAEYFQSAVAFRTARTISLAVIFGPEGILTGTLWPVPSALMCDPPTSITRICTTHSVYR